jgi:hypothetical protein
VFLCVRKRLRRFGLLIFHRLVSRSPIIPFTSLSVEDYKVIVRRLAKKYNKNVDVDAITKKNLPIATQYGVRQFIKKAEDDILS